MPREGQSVYSEWFNYVIKPQIKVFKSNIEDLMSKPSDPEYIAGQDIRDIVKIAHYFEVDIEHYDLKNSTDYYKAIGDIQRKIKSTIMDDLQPKDPDLEFYKQKFGNDDKQDKEEKRKDELIEKKNSKIKELRKKIEEMDESG